jgi:hypothetical protein
MLETPVAKRLETEIADLKGRVKTAADLSELVRQKALPTAPVTVYVIPAGLRVNGGDSGANATTAEIDEVLALVIVLRTASDVTGTRGLVKLDPLILEILETLTGWDPDQVLSKTTAHPVIGVFRPLGGQTLKVDAGVIFYQLEFACPWQLRIL